MNWFVTDKPILEKKEDIAYLDRTGLDCNWIVSDLFNATLITPIVYDPGMIRNDPNKVEHMFNFFQTDLIRSR